MVYLDHCDMTELLRCITVNGRLNVKITVLAEAECAAECCNRPSTEAKILPKV